MFLEMRFDLMLSFYDRQTFTGWILSVATHLLSVRFLWLESLAVISSTNKWFPIWISSNLERFSSFLWGLNTLSSKIIVIEAKTQVLAYFILIYDYIVLSPSGRSCWVLKGDFTTSLKRTLASVFLICISSIDYLHWRKDTMQNRSCQEDLCFGLQIIQTGLYVKYANQL